ncbi:unnamed protein product [Protopolystoma xenopodis]|uniref:Uncharacterized protein n=1 Tax=Protopolystoma xenopodis TaxID=117903 RepID=A0A448WVK3_9PLAT|nr:unnamed protein product [Protopolystoma xenopodis]
MLIGCLFVTIPSSQRYCRRPPGNCRFFHPPEHIRHQLLLTRFERSGPHRLLTPAPASSPRHQARLVVGLSGQRGGVQSIGQLSRTNQTGGLHLGNCRHSTCPLPLHSPEAVFGVALDRSQVTGTSRDTEQASPASHGLICPEDLIPRALVSAVGLRAQPASDSTGWRIGNEELLPNCWQKASSEGIKALSETRRFVGMTEPDSTPGRQQLTEIRLQPAVLWPKLTEWMSRNDWHSLLLSSLSDLFPSRLAASNTSPELDLQARINKVVSPNFLARNQKMFIPITHSG